MTALLTRIGGAPSHADAPGLWLLSTTDRVPALLKPGYFDRWRDLLRARDCIRVVVHAKGELRGLAELIVVEVRGRAVEVHLLKAHDLPEPVEEAA